MSAIELVRKLFAYSDSGRYETALQLLADDVEVSTPDGVTRGADRWLAARIGFARTVRASEHRIQHVLGGENAVAVEGVWHGVLAASDSPQGVAVALPFCLIAHSADDRLSSLRVYQDQLSLQHQLQQAVTTPQPAHVESSASPCVAQ
jgi:ketosteroid isomerase-like protein